MKVTKGKKQLLVAIITVLVILMASQAFKWYLSETVLDIINKNPNRKYQLTFEKLNIHSFYSGFDISGIKVVPLKKNNLEIEGNIKNLELKEVNWGKLLLKNSLSISNLTIESPEINLRKDTLYHKVEIETSKIPVKRKTERVIQELLADFLVNFELENLEVVNLSLHSLKVGEESPDYGVENLNISAFGIKSDSVVLTYIVPFQLDSILVDVNNAYYQINPYYKAYIGNWNFNSMDSLIKLKSTGIELIRRWDSVSVDLGYQTDIFELHIDSIVIKDIRLYSDSNNLDIMGEKITFYQPKVNDYRNKNIPRREEPVKPLFNKMIQSIPFPLSIDSLIIYGRKELMSPV
jgi:predicted nucleic acid-binding protein